MDKNVIHQKNRAITEKFRKRFKNIKKDNMTIGDVRNELIIRIQKKTGKSKETILKEINHFIEEQDEQSN